MAFSFKQVSICLVKTRRSSRTLSAFGDLGLTAPIVHLGSRAMTSGEQAGGIAPPASRRTEHETLASLGSHQANVPVILERLACRTHRSPPVASCFARTTA